MIDNLKIVTFDFHQINQIWGNTSLLYCSEKEYRVNDEIKNVSVRTYRNLIFRKYNNRLEICGSIHYFWNDGLHNANDFNINASINILISVISKFKINPKLFRVIGLEYGFNIQPTKEVNIILSWLRFYGKKSIIQSINYSNYFISGTNYKSLKIYNKTQDCPKYARLNIMRFEVKTRESGFVQKLGINTFEALLKRTTYKRLTDSILSEWKSVLIFDFDEVELKEKHNTEYWLDAINNKSRNTFANRKKAYFKNLPINSIFYRIQKLLKSKADKFTDCAYSTTVKNKLIVHNRTITKFHFAQSTKIIRYCPITGIELKGKDEDANYIRTSTLRYLQKYEVYKFIEVCNLLLNKSNPNHTKYENDILKHLVKQVRNRYNNPRSIKNIGYRSKKYVNQYELRLWSH
mgnify:CR=1 FL=1